MHRKLNLYGSAAVHALCKMTGDLSMTVISMERQPTDIVHDAGVLRWSNTLTKSPVHASTTCANWDSWNVTMLLVSAFILNRLDYCNSLFYGLQWSTIASFQRVQNAAVRLVLGLSPLEHVSSVLQTLQWLPNLESRSIVGFASRLRIFMYMYTALTGQCRCTSKTS